nr:disease resistance protein RPP13-like isoform X6 [Ipomoea batatas]
MRWLEMDADLDSDLQPAMNGWRTQIWRRWTAMVGEDGENSQILLDMKLGGDGAMEEIRRSGFENDRQRENLPSPSAKRCYLRPAFHCRRHGRTRRRHRHNRSDRELELRERRRAIDRERATAAFQSPPPLPTEKNASPPSASIATDRRVASDRTHQIGEKKGWGPRTESVARRPQPTAAGVSLSCSVAMRHAAAAGFLLEVLKLYDTYVDKQWELLEDDKFCQLIVLEIGKTDLKDWKATGDHFPKLEHLSLISCKELKEIPSGFAEISRLKSIQLAGCHPSVVASAEKIKEEQLDYMNNIVDVVVAEQQLQTDKASTKLNCARRVGGKVEKRRLEKIGYHWQSGRDIQRDIGVRMVRLIDFVLEDAREVSELVGVSVENLLNKYGVALYGVMELGLVLELGGVVHFGIADLFGEEEKPQRDTEGEKTQPYCVKLHQVFQTAMEEIEAIKEELLKIKAEGRKTTHDVLQRLEVLKIYDACVGKLWELPEDDKFCQLIILHISQTNLKDWKATCDHFPKLEHLSLFSCNKLKQIPSWFAEISRLKSIQLRGCSPSVVASAQKIKEEQLDYLNNIVDVVVPDQDGY